MSLRIERVEDGGPPWVIMQGKVKVARYHEREWADRILARLKELEKKSLTRSVAFEAVEWTRARLRERRGE